MVFSERTCFLTGRVAVIVTAASNRKDAPGIRKDTGVFYFTSIQLTNMPGIQKKTSIRYMLLFLAFLLVVGYSNYNVYKKFMRTETCYQAPAVDALFKYDLKTR